MVRRIRIAVAVAVCGVMAGASAGCGAGPASYTAAEAGAEQARLRGLLPKQQEMPDGFSARPRDGWKSPFRPASPECRLVLNMAGGGSPRRAPGPRVAVTYLGDKLGELAGVAMVSYAGDDAERRFAELTEALGDCRVAAGPQAGRSTSFRVSDLELDVVGDEVQAKRLRGRLNGYPYEMHMVFARTGHTLVSLVHTGVAGVDVESTRQLARFLVDRAAA